MNNLLSKLSLYDILSMVIPGGTILLFLSLYAGYNWKMNDGFVDSPIFYFIVVSLAYIIGIVNHVISSEMWRIFRNNPELIRKGLEQLKDETDINILNLNVKNKAKRICVKCLVIVFIVFCCCISLFEYIFRNFNYFEMIFIVLAIMIVILIYLAKMARRKSDNFLLNKYYDAYYYLAVKGKLGPISIIDGQIAFIESMVIPLFLFTLLQNNSWDALLPCITCNPNIYCIKLLILLLCISMIFIVYNRSIKVHYLVWCNFHYYNEQDSQVNSKQNQ